MLEIGSLSSDFSIQTQCSNSWCQWDKNEIPAVNNNAFIDSSFNKYVNGDNCLQESTVVGGYEPGKCNIPAVNSNGLDLEVIDLSFKSKENVTESSKEAIASCSGTNINYDPGQVIVRQDIAYLV